jgi:lysophospholipase L1-like esterase
VTVLDENLFGDLERPDYFFDAYHMNAEGRSVFSPRLARAVANAGDDGVERTSR